MCGKLVVFHSEDKTARFKMRACLRFQHVFALRVLYKCPNWLVTFYSLLFYLTVNRSIYKLN